MNPFSKVYSKTNSSYDSLQSASYSSSKNHEVSRPESLKSASNSKSKSKEKLDKGRTPIISHNFKPSKRQEKSSQDNANSQESMNNSRSNTTKNIQLAYSIIDEELMELKK